MSPLRPLVAIGPLLPLAGLALAGLTAAGLALGSLRLLGAPSPRFGLDAAAATDPRVAAVQGRLTDWLAGAPNPRPQDFPLLPDREPALYSQLDAGDRSWVPQIQPIPGGGLRYTYRRESGQPPLSIPQIKALIQSPPKFQQERLTVERLLPELRRRGVLVVLGPPRKRGAAGEWDPRAGVLRVRSDVPARGSREFAKVLNHETIHVAQSCRQGSIRAYPAPLGLPRQLDADAQRHLADGVYAGSSARDLILEQEAYANQARLDLGEALLRRHCRLS